MVTRDGIMQALRDVMDPEIGKSLVDLNMIREVKVDGGDVEVTVALTTGGCPLRGHIQESVEKRLREVPGVENVTVHMSAMTDEERRRLFGQNLENIPVLATGATVIAVGSGKGGVGKSTVTVNLAVTLARRGHKVGIIDADIYGFSVFKLLGIPGGTPEQEDGKLRPMEAHGVKAISMGAFVSEETPIIWRGPLLRRMLQQFLSDVAWGQLDYLLIDLPPGTGDIALDVAQLIPGSYLVVVTTPQKLARGVASRAAHMARAAKQNVVGVIENMSYFECPRCGDRYPIFGEGGGEDLAQRLGVPLLGQIPLVPEVREAGDEGSPTALDERSPVGKAFRRIVDNLEAIFQA